MSDAGKSCYINSIIEQIHKEIKPGNQVFGKIRGMLQKASVDELERVYDLFERFGVESIFEAITAWNRRA